EVGPGETRRQHTYAGHVWLLLDGRERPVAAFRARAGQGRFVLDAQTPAPAAASPRRRGRRDANADRSRRLGTTSPDGRWRVAIRDHNVVLVAAGDNATGDSTQVDREGQQEDDPVSESAVVDERILTTDGTAEAPYREPIWWAPDGKHFGLFQTRLGDKRQVTLVESSPRDQLQPKTILVDYAKPGDRIDHPRMHVFGIDGETHHVVDDEQAPNPYAIQDVSWQADSSAIRMLYNERGHQRLAVLSIDIAGGKTRAVIDERSETFIDYNGKRYLRFLDETDEAIWMSERSGWNHLWLIRQSTGEVIRPLTSGNYVVREVVEMDVASRTLVVAVGGYYPDQDPYHLHLLRVSLDGEPPLPLTAGDGHHTWEWSPSGEHLVVRYSRIDLPPVTEIRSPRTGERICVVERADAAALNRAVGHPPRRFVAKGRDGETDIHGMIVFPHDFDPDDDRRYPVLELIYAGPHSAHVPKAFGRHLELRKTADLGFIVVRIDGMGTSHRSKAFHDVCWKNLADAGFPDRIAWLRAAAEEFPQLDLSRVGIWGGSAGGQNALRALIDHGDFYRAAFADCGCHDNRMDKIWWNELWMGWPIGPHYEEQSNVTGVERVTGALMLAVGELDRNVDPASTLQVVDALIRADKDFDLLFIPGAGHGAGGSRYGERRRKAFFLHHLWGNPSPSASVGYNAE
ncbi:MAG: S9 family peptidase, partial [Planctomycetaceae bacterium]